MKKDDKFRWDVLRKLQQNNFNYQKTAKETGVARQTIRKWVVKDETAVVKQAALIREVTDTSKTGIIVDKVRFGKRVFKMKDLILTKMEDVLPDCKDLDTLTRALKIVSEVEIANNHDGDIPNILSGTQNFIQIINNQIKLNQKNNQHE